MEMERLLAKLTAGTVNLSGPGGSSRQGTTPADICAGLGYVQSYLAEVDKRLLIDVEIPIGILLVQVKYCDCEISKHLLNERFPADVIRAWWDFHKSLKSQVSRQQLYRLARVLLREYCKRGGTTLVPVSMISADMKMDSRTWNRKLAGFYRQQWAGLNARETQVLDLLTRKMFGR